MQRCEIRLLLIVFYRLFIVEKYFVIRHGKKLKNPKNHIVKVAVIFLLFFVHGKFDCVFHKSKSFWSLSVIFYMFRFLGVFFGLPHFVSKRNVFFLWGFISYLWYFAVFLQIKQTCGWIITFNCTLYLLEANTLLPFSLTKRGSNGFCGIFCCCDSVIEFFCVAIFGIYSRISFHLKFKFWII